MMQDIHVNKMCRGDYESDEITSVTARGETTRTEREGSVIEDDVGSERSFLDMVPERDLSSGHKPVSKEIEIIDVYSKCRLEEDASNLGYERMEVDSSRERDWKMEVDRYDLNEEPKFSKEYTRFSDENLQTVKMKHPQPLVTLTRHEPDYRYSTLSTISPSFEPENIQRENESMDSLDIGRQISQLAQRIESLGNISRVYQAENVPIMIQDCAPHRTDLGTNSLCQRDPDSLKTARKLDKVERLQKRQEAMQSRLTDLAKRLNDSTKDLTRTALPCEDDFQSGGLPKTSRGRDKKSSSQKSSKCKKKSPHKSPSFLTNILNEGPQTGEVPLLSSSYCLHHDLSTGTPESVMTEATNKYVTDELHNIRQEFRTQVEEIRRLLSDKYQRFQEDQLPSKEVLTRATNESLADQIDKSITKIRRDTSPSLKNITNLTRGDLDLETCPLDKYLTRRPLDRDLPSLNSDITPSLRPGILPSVAKAIKSKQRMFSDPVEAERFLIELRSRRNNLENNINCLERAKEGQFLFSILEKLQGNELSFETGRIQAMVEDAIVSVNPEIQWQVKQEFQRWLEKRRQRQQEVEDAIQHQGKIRPVPKSSRVVSHVIQGGPSNSSVPQKPWLCKKYWTVRSKVDTGLKKPEPRVPRSTSPQVRPVPEHTTPGTHSTWANRRRYRTPYLHFVNDVKLAHKSVGPLADSSRRIPIISSSKKVVFDSLDHQGSQPDDGLILLGMRQYSLDYVDQDESKLPGTEVEQPPQKITKATSPRPQSKRQCLDHAVDSVQEPLDESSTLSLEVQGPYGVTKSPPPDAPVRPMTPPSPSLSEIGAGIQIQRVRSDCHPRDQRVGPFKATDPLEERRITSLPVNVRMRPVERSTPDLDMDQLRHLVERALYDHIQVPSSPSVSSVDFSLPKGTLVTTPLPSVLDHYSEDFGSETSPKERTDISLTMVDGIRTPEISHMSTDHERHVHIDTPPVSPSRSLKNSPKRQVILEKVSEAVQTISEKGNQTIEDKEMQTCSPRRTQTPRMRPEPESVDSLSTTSGLEGSLTDTLVESWSDGMWLLDRSEGEMADHYVQPVTRWNLGSCPENPLWPHGTEELMKVERQSTQSFGEFIKPTLPGLIPTMDGVLQLNTFPFKTRYCSINLDEEDNYSGPYSGRPAPKNSSSDFNLIRVSRDSKSRFTSPRNVRNKSPEYSQGSIGEVELPQEYDLEENEDEEEYQEKYVPIKVHRSKMAEAIKDGEHPFKQIQTRRSNESYNSDPPAGAFLGTDMRLSGDSNHTEGVLVGDSYSDRMKVDPMKYLRGSKQSQSDFSDTGALMSTGQVIAAAFKGTDSVDFDGLSDHFRDRYIQPSSLAPESGPRTKPMVIMPTLDNIDQSERSQSEISEILLQ